MTIQLATQTIDSINKVSDATDSSGDAYALSVMTGVVSHLDEQISTYYEDIQKVATDKQVAMTDKSMIMPALSGTLVTEEVAKEKAEISSPCRVIKAKAQYEKVIAYCKKYGISYADKAKKVGQQYYVAEDLCKTIEMHMDTRLQDLNSVSETKMIYFQGVIDSRKQALLMLSNFISANNEARREIIRNIKG